MTARRIATPLFALCLLLFVVAAGASAVPPPPPLVANGGFESNALDPWTPWGGTVRLADQTDWTAAGGNKSVELSGYGRIYQDISTTAGQRYDLSFAYAGNPSASCSGVKTLDVSWSGGLPSQTGKGGSFSFDTTGRTTASMGWQTAHMLVDATSSITALAFGDDNAPVGCGIVIDDVAMGTPAAGQTGTQVVGPDPSPVLGEPLTVTAMVLGSSAAVTPTGSVQFSVDGTPTGAPVPLTSAQAQKTFNGLARGVHAVDATYTPDSVSFNSSGVRVRVAVRQAGTTTNLSVDPSPAAFGDEVTLTADVDVLAPGAGGPTGSIQFADEYGPIGDPVPIDADGVAQIALVEYLGDHYMSAYYSGDDDFYASTGGATLSVFDPNATTDPPPGDLTPTTIALVSSKNPVAPGESYTVTATVSPAAASDNSLGGSVTFTTGTVTHDPVQLGPEHTASITLTAPVGVSRQTVRARYSGNTFYSASNASLLESIRSATTTRTPTTPVQPPQAQPVDKTAPKFTLTITPARLARAIRSGIRIHVSCDENCSADLRLRLPARQARALGLKARGAGIVVARGSYAFADRRRSVIVLRFSARYRKALARARRVPLRLTTAVSDLAGNEAVRLQTLTLKR
jgi:hypothetical protein